MDAVAGDAPQPRGRPKLAIVAGVVALVAVAVVGVLLLGGGVGSGDTYLSYSAPDEAAAQQLADDATERVLELGWPQDTVAAYATVIGTDPNSPLNSRDMSASLCGYEGSVSVDAFWGSDATSDGTLRIAVAGLGGVVDLARLGENLAERTDACGDDELADSGDSQILLREASRESRTSQAGTSWDDHRVSFGALAVGTDGNEYLLLFVYRNHGVVAAQVVQLLPADDVDGVDQTLRQLADDAHSWIDATLADAVDAEVLSDR